MTAVTAEGLRRKPVAGGIIDIAGQHFGRLTALHATEKRAGDRNVVWLCKCECGAKLEVQSNNLRTGCTRSCGCLRREASARHVREHLTAHGDACEPRAKEYLAWKNAGQRTTNPKCQGWKYYGGRGIKMCDRWLNSYENFLADVGRAPSPKHSIDRINNNGNYEPGNVRWATASEQVRNRRCSSNLASQSKGEK